MGSSSKGINKERGNAIQTQSKLVAMYANTLLPPQFLPKPFTLHFSSSHPPPPPRLLLAPLNCTPGDDGGTATQPPSPPPPPVEIRFRRGRGSRRRRQQQQEEQEKMPMKEAAPKKKWEEMSYGEKALELYLGEKGALFWLNKFAYASIFIIIGAWILFRFVGPALNLYQLDTPPLAPENLLKGS